MRKLSGLIMLLLLSVVLVSCSVGEDDDPEPTEAPTEPPVSTTLTEEQEDTDVGIPGTPEVDVVDDATPADIAMAASPAVGADATPEMSIAATPSVIDEATPIAADATPAETLMATPEGATMPPLEATPIATPQIGATSEASPVDEASGMVVPPVAEPTATPVVIEMTGTIMLGGNVNEAYVITDEGCVGLGQYEDLHDGRQVVIRNESGTIVSVTTLDAAPDMDGCAWEFVASVPESDFYSVSIPMEFEQVFPKAQVTESGGEVVIELP